MKFLILCIAVGVASAYPTGAPEDICNDPDLTPQHGKPAKDHTKEPPPFVVTAAKVLTSSAARQKINVTISGLEGTTFLGFAVAAENDKGEHIGSWIPVKGVYHEVKKCHVATHDGKEPKESVSLLWRAPAGKQQSPKFVVTIAMTGYDYWTRMPVKYLY